MNKTYDYAECFTKIAKIWCIKIILLGYAVYYIGGSQSSCPTAMLNSTKPEAYSEVLGRLVDHRLEKHVPCGHDVAFGAALALAIPYTLTSMMRLNRWLKGTFQGKIGNLGFSPPVNVRIRLCFSVDLPIIQCLGLKSAPLLHNVHRDIFTWFGGMNWSLQDRQKERPSGGKMSKILKQQFLKPTKTVTKCIKMLQQIAAWRLFPPLNAPPQLHRVSW